MVKTSEADVTWEAIAERISQAIDHIKAHGITHQMWVAGEFDDAKEGAVCAIGAIMLLQPKDAETANAFAFARDAVGVATARHLANTLELPLAYVSALKGTLTHADPIDVVSNWFEGERKGDLHRHTPITKPKLLAALNSALSVANARPYVW